MEWNKSFDYSPREAPWLYTLQVAGLLLAYIMAVFTDISSTPSWAIISQVVNAALVASAGSVLDRPPREDVRQGHWCICPWHPHPGSGCLEAMGYDAIIDLWWENDIVHIPSADERYRCQRGGGLQCGKKPIILRDFCENCAGVDWH